MATVILDINGNLDESLTQRQVQMAANVYRPRKITRQEIEANFLEVFELVGGVPRLAIWANDPQNYGEFIKIIAKMLPKEMVDQEKAGFIYQSLVPQSRLTQNVVDIKAKQEQSEEITDVEPE